MSNPKKKSKSVKKRTVKRNNIPLKRYNKIVSLIVKDNKKKGIDYQISEVRKQVSESIYPEFKNVQPSKIRLKQIKAIINEVDQEGKEKVDTVRIKAQNVPREYFDISLEWYELGEDNRRNGYKNPILELNRNYPDIPIVIKTGDKELRIQGVIGDYQNSKLQAFVEEVRMTTNNESGLLFSGVPAWFERKNKQYAFWGTDDVELPPENILDFEDAGEKAPIFKPERKKREKKEEKEVSKKTIKEEKKPETKKTDGKLSEKEKEQGRLRIFERIDNIKADYKEEVKELRQDFKDGIYDKDEFKEEKKSLTDQKNKEINALNEELSKYNKGGII